MCKQYEINQKNNYTDVDNSRINIKWTKHLEGNIWTSTVDKCRYDFNFVLQSMTYIVVYKYKNVF